MKETLSINNKAMHFISACFLACMLSTAVFAADEASAEEGKFHRFWPDNLYAVDFPSDKVGYIAGYSGSLFKTEDGGETWSGIYMGTNELIRKMSFVDEQNGWAVGHRGSILHTADAGLTWEIQKTDAGVYLRDISFADLNNGWAVGHDTHIWHTADGGKTWESQHLTGFEGRDLPRLHGVIAKDANTAILVGEFGMVAHTEDAGNLWMVSFNDDPGTLLSVDYFGDGAIAVGLDGGIYTLMQSTQEQRDEVTEMRLAKHAKAEAKAMKKAKRRKKAYVAKEYVPFPETEVDYQVTRVDSGTKEHLYGVTTASNGRAYVVGVSTLLQVTANVSEPTVEIPVDGVEAVVKEAKKVIDKLTEEEPPVLVTYSVDSLKPAEEFPLPFVWMGGVSVTPSGDIWAAGILGLVVKGNTNDMTFDTKLNIAAPGAVKLVSNRWGEK